MMCGRVLAGRSALLPKFWPRRRATVVQNVFKFSGACGISSSNMNRSLIDCVKNELKLENLEKEPLPVFTNFHPSLVGCVATLQRTINNEKITVKLNVNEAIEGERETEDGEVDESPEPFFIPMFTVTVSKPSGDALSFECSFDTFGEYNEPSDEWDNLSIDSVSIQSKGDSPEAVYKVDPTFLSTNFQECILSYLEQRGIDRTFTSEVISFYREFEHHNYVNGFLEKLEKFLLCK